MRVQLLFVLVHVACTLQTVLLGKEWQHWEKLWTLTNFQLISTFYLSTCQITDITVHYVLRHCHTQWLITEKVLVRTREQIDNHHEYFLIELPKQKSFRAKTEYWIQIDISVSKITLMISPCYRTWGLSSLLSQKFCRFLIPLQKSTKNLLIVPDANEINSESGSKIYQAWRFYENRCNTLVT